MVMSDGKAKGSGVTESENVPVLALCASRSCVLVTSLQMLIKK